MNPKYETTKKEIKAENTKEDDFCIHHADALTQVKTFKKRGLKVNHIITDPPYNISQKNRFHILSNRTGLDFGEWDRDFDLTGWIEDYAEILENGGSMIVFNSFFHLGYIADAMKKAGLVVKDVLKWRKANPMPRNINRRYVQDTEFAIWAVKPGAKWIFNKRIENKYERAEFHAPVVSGSEKTAHPTQKSLKLMNEIIEIHTNKNELILDPFMGSGTTGVAAIYKERRFIGIELEVSYYNIAKTRLDETQIIKNHKMSKKILKRGRQLKHKAV